MSLTPILTLAEHLARSLKLAAQQTIVSRGILFDGSGPREYILSEVRAG